jgi:hypothetical protein
MARKAGQIVARGARSWLVRVYLGRDPQTGTGKYHKQTIHGPFREAQRFLNLKLQQPDNGRGQARVRVRSRRDYEALLRLDIRPALGARLLARLAKSVSKSLCPDVRPWLVGPDN